MSRGIVERLSKRYPGLLYSSIVEVIRRRIALVERELAEVNTRLRRFEEKYGVCLEEYERSMGEGFEEHEEWVEWRFLVEAKKSLEAELDELKKLLGEALREVQRHHSGSRRA